ncbi:MAG: ribonuclease HII [Halobacteriaceae archaeon]
MPRLGVDEAGKGPVLGGMVAAAVLADPDALPDGVTDSKRLSPERRRALDTTLQSHADVAVGVAHIPVAAIDDPDTDMNSLTVEAHAAAVRAVPADLDDVAGTLDAADPDADRFARRVTDRLGSTPTLEGRHGADATDAVVGAASIVAKVARDAHVASLATDYDADLGSGYPGDPVTRSFLADYVDTHGSLPPCARRSWQTSRDVLAAHDQAVLTEF